MLKREATDLYLTVGVAPTLRINNQLFPMTEKSLSDDDIQAILNDALTSRQRREYDTNFELNMAIDMGDAGRFRVNVLRQKQHPAMVIRRIVSKIPTFEELRLPRILEKLALEKRGLILLSGVTSSGKSTTLASMVDYRNRMVGGHIITIEDPVEYFHEHKKGIVTQREVGIDTASYQIALKNALRQKPDVILVGEIRDAEVMEQAISAAETGHLCLATIHTSNTSQAVERIINFFPEDRHQQVRIALSMNLRAIIGQRLITCTDQERGVIVAAEVLLNEALIKELILKGETGKIREVMAQNNSAGMIVFDQYLLNLYKEGLISEETAIAEADIATDMKMKIRQISMKDLAKASGHGVDTSALSL
jgi:twitching motility protein PilU